MKINIGKIKKWLSLLLLSIYSLCSFSCNDLFSKDLHSDLLNGFTTKIHFYSDKEGSGQEIKKTTKRFEIGSTITLDDLPNYTDSEIKNWKDKKRLSRWKIYRKTGSTEIIDQDIENLFVENVELDLYAIWDTQYKIIYSFQNADLYTYESEEHIAYGPAGSSVSITPSINIPEGYEPTTNSPVSLTITDDGNSSVEFKFDRKTVTITLDPNGGSFSNSVTSNSLTGTYGALIDENAIPEPSKTGCRFLRWDPELPLTFPSADTTYTAVYNTSTSIEINPGYPSVNKISLGELESAVAYLVGSQNILTFKVSAQAYNAIKGEPSSKKIKWTLSGDPSKTGESLITYSVGLYKAVLDVTDLSLGMHSITITAESATEDVVLESIESVISVVR